MKKTTAILLTLLLLFGTVSFAPAAAAEEAPAYAAGDIIQYGTYPQSLVTDEALIETLNSLPGPWTAYGYYGSVATSGPYAPFAEPFEGMQYRDIVYSGVKYRALKMEAYRPFTDKEGTYNQQTGGFELNTVYWFRYDPLQWRVLDPATGYVMSNTLIDSQPFAVYMEYYASYNYTGAYGSSRGADNIGYWQTISTWLNEDFLNTAFSAAQQENILADALVNDYWNMANSGAVTHKYDAPAVSDKIFLPAWNDLCNPAYGFKQNAKTADPARALSATDYARAQGLESASAQTTFKWRMRTVGKKITVLSDCIVDENGACSDFSNTSDRYAGFGVCPAMRLAVLTSESSETAKHAVGDLITFGSYPQTRVTDGDTVAALTARLSAADVQPLSQFEHTWNTKAIIHTDYADMVLEGKKYRAVIKYPELLMGDESTFAAEYSFASPDTTITDAGQEKNVYFYRFEPLIWRVLDPDTGLVMANQIVESLVFQQNHFKDSDDYWADYAWADAEHTHYATDYAVSDVRVSLNSVFYQTAFTAAQKENILETELDNRSAWTLQGITGFEDYDWETTVDKIFLLSTEEVTNPAYGFLADKSAEDPARILFGNDYAGYSNPNAYNQYWALRNSPADIIFVSRRVGSCNYKGKVVRSAAWANELQPICPAMRLQDLDSSLPGETDACETHVPAVISVTSATCTEPGVGHSVCAVCGETLGEGVTIAPLGHDLIGHDGKEATCGEAGWASYETCARCDYTTYESIPATGAHSWAWITDTEATCGTAGEKHEVCSGCGATCNAGTTIPATGAHSWTWVTDTEATCSAAGMQHEVCGVCNAARNENTRIEPTGNHVYSAATIKETALKAPAVCAGNAVYYYSCKDCGTVEHNDSHTFEVAGTALRHISSDWIIDSNATCGTAGSKHTACTVCHTVLETQEIGRLPHTPETVAGKAATCKETGLTDGVVCSVCGDVIQAQTVIGKKPHSYDAGMLTQQPTCTTDGRKTFVCAECGETKTESVGKLGHAWGGWAVLRQPTCTSEGQQIRTCTRDGSHKETKPIARKAHTDNGSGYCRDCGADLKAAQRCKFCGEIHSGPFAWLIKIIHSILGIFKR